MYLKHSYMLLHGAMMVQRLAYGSFCAFVGGPSWSAIQLLHSIRLFVVLIEAGYIQ